MAKFIYNIGKMKNEHSGIVDLKKLKEGSPPGPGSGRHKKPTLRDEFNDFKNEVRNGFKKVNERLDKVENRLDTVIRLNNLKTE